MSPGARIQIEALVSRAKEHGTSGLVLLEAGEGLGRTHLLRELASDTSRTTLLVRCREGGARAALLHALLGNPQDAAAAVRSAPQLASVDEAHRAAELALLEALLEAADAPMDDGAREALFTVLLRWIEAAAGKSLAVVAFDDAHRANPDDVAFIDFLAAAKTGFPLLLVLSFDAAPHRATSAFAARLPAWRTDATRTALSLSPLDPGTLGGLLTATGLSPAAAANIARVSRGNPRLALALAQIPPAEVESFPSLDAVRVRAVAAGGPEVLAAARVAAALPQPFLPAAVRHLAPDSGDALETLCTHGILRAQGAGLFFDDERLPGALCPDGDTPLRKRASAWARAALDTAETSALEALVPLAFPDFGEAGACSWFEVLAGEAADSAKRSLWLEAAAEGTNGVRQAVLLRRLAELQLFRGQPDRALATLQRVPRLNLALSAPPTGHAADLLSRQPRGLLEAWESMTPEEILTSVELVRAECFSHLVKREETLRAYDEVEKRLQRLKGPVAAHLWIRWATTMSWFLCEILGRPSSQLAACQTVRQKVPAETLMADPLAMEFLRGEEIAAAGMGDFRRAGALVDQMLALAHTANNLRQECLAWNARSLLHFGLGELPQAKAGFERARELGRQTRWLRREAIAQHNLALVLAELGELDAARAAEAQYWELSKLFLNHAATAEAPLVLATVALARGNVPEAEMLLGEARRAADENEWVMLATWARALSGRARLMKYLQSKDTLELNRARSHYLAAIDTFEEQGTAWFEELDPADVITQYAWVLSRTGQPAEAAQLLKRTAMRMPTQNVASHAALLVGLALVTKGDVDAALSWFKSRGYATRVKLYEALRAAS